MNDETLEAIVTFLALLEKQEYDQERADIIAEITSRVCHRCGSVKARGERCSCTWEIE